MDDAGPDAIDAAATVPELMRTAARVATEVVAADGCALSRVVGDVLIELAEFAGSRQTLYLGHGYLISDYPLTLEAIEAREPRSVYVPDPDADPREAELLGELGFTALLMLPICARNEVWGLGELYRDGERRFTADDAERAARLFERVGDRIVALEGDR